MSEDFEIINKVANSGLVNFDISDLVPKGKRLGIDIKDTIAVGDNYNDIPMLKTAGLSVAVSNAVDDAKKAARYVTKADNNKGAVAELIEKFIINRISG